MRDSKNNHAETKKSQRTRRKQAAQRRQKAHSLTVISFLLAVLGGAGTALWAIHSVGLFATPLSVSQTQNTTAGLKSGSETSSPSVSPSRISSAASGGQPLDSGKTTLPSKSAILKDLLTAALPSSALLHVSAQSQLPELANGCEVTSLSMLLAYEGHPVSKVILAEEEPQDKTPLVMNQETKQIISWGNPDVGFVGSVTGQTQMGYGIYHGPLVKLVDEISPNRGLDLTGLPFSDIENVVAHGTPVLVWDTATFSPTDDWVTWQSPTGLVHATFDEHAVLLVGYTDDAVYINNPLTGIAAQKVPIQSFVEAWEQMGKQAITVAPQRFQN